MRKNDDFVNLGVGAPERFRKPSGAELVQVDNYVERLRALCDRVDRLIAQIQEGR